MNLRKSIPGKLAIVFWALSSTLAFADTRTDCVAGKLAKGPGLLIDSRHLPPDSATNLSSVTVCGINQFRYFASPQTQSKISNPPAPPANLFSAMSGTAAAVQHASSQAIQANVVPMATQAVLQAESPENKVNDLRSSLNTLQQASEDQTTSFSNNQIAASQKVDCYQSLANQFSAVLLTIEQEAQLTTILQGPPKACYASVGIWDQNQTQTIGNLIDRAVKLNSDIAAFEVSPDYKTYINEASADPAARKADLLAMISSVGTVITQLQTLLNPTTIAGYNATVTTGVNWDQRAAYILNTPDPWDVSFSVACHMQWFGKTESQTISLLYTDYAQATPTPASTPAFSFSNACLASLTVSSGLGISTVRNSTYAFIPQTNYSLNPPVTTQVIGYATNASITPFYVGQMNYSYLHPERSIGLHISGGAGVSTSSSGTTSDFFVGNAFSFFHRAIFVTPSAHFTQRQQLMSGYAAGNPQGSLSSVPTITSWKTGFAITITLPVLQ